MARTAETDRWLFVVTLALCLTGAVMIFSASAVTAQQMYGHSYVFMLRQVVWLLAGLAGMFGLMKLDYHRLREPAVVYTALCVVAVLLMCTFFLDKSHATHRWIKVGPVNLQPSELTKPVVILYLAWFLDLKRRTATRLEFNKEDLLQTLLPAAPPILFLLVAFVSYRYARIMAFLHPDSDPQGAGFQLMQSLIAVGSGGFSGVGLMEGKQKLFYLPEAHTDFIYAVICEELGFLGAIVVIALFAVYGWRGLRAAFCAPDNFGRLLALGITLLVLCQALINFAVVLGIVPTKGIPLPFVSYGGSSLLVMLLATGVLLNIAQQSSEPAWS